jgi:hypothetical protein
MAMMSVPDIRLERAAWTWQDDHVVSLTPAGMICERSDGVLWSDEPSN